MENNYSVQFKVHNKKTGAWGNNVVLQTSDYDASITKYYSELGRLYNASDFDFVMVMWVDMFGNTKSDYRDSRGKEAEA